MNLPNTQLVHYYEHFVNYYALHIFKLSEGSKRTMKKIYESNEMNLMESK